MKKNGFTLVELLGVIVLIGLIVAIVYPNIKQLISDQKDKLVEKQINLIETTSYDWIVNNTGKIPKDGSNYYLHISELKSDGYIKDKDIKNPKTNETLTGCIKISWNGNNYSYSYGDKCSD